MTFNEIVQSPGRKFVKDVYYYPFGSSTIVHLNDDLERVKISYECSLTGTIMYCMEIESKTDIPLGATIYYKVTAKTQSGESAVQIFSYFYKNSSEYQADTKTYIIKCYDCTMSLMVDHNKIEGTYPMKVSSYLSTLLSNYGLSYIGTLPNGNKEIESDIYDGIGYTERDIVDDILAANGLCFKVVSEKKFITTKISSSQTAITINDDILKNQNIEFGEHYGAINTIVLSRSNETDNVYYPSPLPTIPYEYKIKDNQLMNNNDRADYLAGIYSNLNGTEFDIFDCELTGYGVISPLQKVQFSTGGKSYSSYIFGWECEYTQGYTESIFTSKPEETETDYKYASSTDKAIKQAYIIVNKKDAEILLAVSKEEERAEGEEEKISGQIKLKVSKDDNNQIVSMINASANVITLNSNRLAVNSDNFTLTSDGTLTASKGTFKGDINSSANAYIGDSLFVGQNQSSSGTGVKYIKFSDDVYIRRFKLSSASMLEITADTGNSGIGVASNTINLSTNSGNNGLRVQNGTTTNNNNMIINGTLNSQNIDCGTCVLGTANDTNVSFNKTFAQAPIVILTCTQNNTGTYVYSGNVIATSTTGFTAFCATNRSSASGITFNWIAIGAEFQS